MKNNKKLKKKLSKRKNSEEVYSSNEEEYENKMEVEEHIEVKKDISHLDIKYSNIFDLSGIKGHRNFYTKQNIDVGIYYFEVTPNNMDYSILDYISNKRIDEFSKRYYEIIQNNAKDYQPNIRIGLIHEKGDIDLPLGADKYSYGLRIRDGVLISDGEYISTGYKYTRGDIIGVLVHLKPPRPEFLKTNHEDEVNKECHIKYYVNGHEIESRFVGLLEGNYKPTVTLYNFSKATINFGPNYKFTNFDEYNNIKHFNDLI
jgi:hypothetical protein